MIATGTKPRSFHEIIPTYRQHGGVQEPAVLIGTATTQAC
jgi:hypothetical protein